MNLSPWSCCYPSGVSSYVAIEASERKMVQDITNRMHVFLQSFDRKAESRIAAAKEKSLRLEEKKR